MLLIRAELGWFFSILGGVALSASLLASSQARCGENLLDPVFGPTALDFVLNDKAIRNELVVSDSQLALLKQTEAERHNATFAAMKRAREARVPGKPIDSKSEVLALDRTVLPALEKILTEQQFRRLQQITYQKLIRRSEMQPLLYADFVKCLQLSNDEMFALERVRQMELAKWSARASELNARLSKTIEDILTPEQHARFKEIYGEPHNMMVDFLYLSPSDKEIMRRCPRLYLLGSEELRHDVELLDQQYAEIKTLQEKFYRRQGELKRERRELPTEECSKYLAQAFDELAKSCIVEEERILLPHQIRRLNQIVFQVQTSEKDRWGDPLLRDTVATALNLSEDQRKRLYAEYTDGRQRIAQELNGLWKQTLRTVIESLTPDQQARYHRLVGKPFE